MYKTVRHGENSLQYTILPQDGDEESGKSGGGQGKNGGGGTGGGGKGGGGNRGGGGGGGRGCCRPRTALFLVLTALLVGVVTASVAVPLLLTTDLLSLPGAAFPFSEHRPQIQSRPHQYQHHPAYNATAFHRHPVTATTAATTSTTNTQTAIPADTTTPMPSTTKPASEPVSGDTDIPAAPGPPQEEQRLDMLSTTASVPGIPPQKVKGIEGEEDDEDEDDDDDDEDDEEDNSAPVAVPIEQDDRVDDEDDDEGEGPSADGPAMHTASTEAVRGGDAAGYLAAPAAPSPPAGNATRNSIWVTPPRNSTRKEGYQMSEAYGSTPDVVAASTDSPTVFTTTTAAPQVPLITATTPPRPITFPTAPTEGVKAGNKHGAWQGPRWLFTDPSSYLQWTGYNRDGLLLPIILGTVVIVVPATIAVCFLIIRRRRRQKDLRRETIGKIASDLQYGDKATLLADASEEE